MTTHESVEYKRQIDNLKCCGNCKKYHKVKCPLAQENTIEFDQTSHHFNGYCDDWQHDNLTQIKRYEICEQL